MLIAVCRLTAFGGPVVVGNAHRMVTKEEIVPITFVVNKQPYPIDHVS